jgi:DNA-binding CsgD family transcriptional regulator
MGLTDSQSAAGLVLILDPERRVAVEQSDLQQRYGLTIAECNLANCMVEGMDVNACCARLNIRRSTARMHLRSLFVKTRTRRQAELVALLFKNHGLIDLGRGSTQGFENFSSPDLVDV